MESTTNRISLSTIQNALAGRYVIERELGRGGMATVYLAQDTANNRPVAVKVLLPELAATLGMDRFMREIDVGTRLKHPRIVGVLDSGSAEGVLYYVMPFVDGASLRDLLDKKTQLGVEETITIAQQVADALAYAHREGVIHRDIKPENILLDSSGAMVADFGIARAVTVAGGENLTKTGMAVGTPTYMSPEQAMGSKDVTAESDIYSLACVVYEMLAGQPPFTGPTSMALLARHSLDNVPSLKIVRGTVPDAVEDAILRAMAKVPADRFHSATDFSEALTDHEGAARRRRDSLANKAIAATTREIPVTPAGGRKRSMLVAAAIVPILAVAGWFGWQKMQGGGTPAGLEGDFAKKNIAVMYFEDRSPDKQLGYLADGLTEALIDELSAVPELKVVSRNGSVAFKGNAGVPSDSIARALKVGTVVNGVVESTDKGVRVTVRLDDVGGKQIGKATIEQPKDNSLALQDSLARQVSLLVREQVGQEIREIVSRVGTRSDAAWEAMQRAKQTLGDAEGLIAARDLPAALAKLTAADEALGAVENLDKGWRTPIVERARLAYRAARLTPSSEPSHVKWVEGGLAHAERALAKSATDAEALEMRGTLHYWQWLNNMAGDREAARKLLASAEQDLRAATAANSLRASAWTVLSHLLINKGQLSEAKLAAENAFNADPYQADVDRTIQRLFLASLDLGIRDEAVRWCAEGARRFPENFRFIECKLWQTALPGSKPDINEVWKTYEVYVAKSPPQSQAFNTLKGKLMVALALVRAGQLDSAKALANSSQGDSQIDPPGELTNIAAIVFAQAGDKDAALELVAKHLAANPQQREFAANDKSWWLKDLRSDPRYQALVKGAN